MFIRGDNLRKMVTHYKVTQLGHFHATIANKMKTEASPICKCDACFCHSIFFGQNWSWFILLWKLEAHVHEWMNTLTYPASLVKLARFHPFSEPKSANCELKTKISRPWTFYSTKLKKHTDMQSDDCKTNAIHASHTNSQPYHCCPAFVYLDYWDDKAYVPHVGIILQ